MRDELAGERKQRHLVDEALTKARQDVTSKDGQLLAKDGELTRAAAALEEARQNAQSRASQLSLKAGELRRADDALEAQQDAESTKQQLGAAETERRRFADALEKAEQDARIKGVALVRKDDELRLVTADRTGPAPRHSRLRGQLAAAVAALEAANRTAGQPAVGFGDDAARRVTATGAVSGDRGGTIPLGI